MFFLDTNSNYFYNNTSLLTNNIVESLSLYPTPQCIRLLKESIATINSVSLHQVYLANGGFDALNQIKSLLITSKDDKFIMLVPNFIFDANVDTIIPWHHSSDYTLCLKELESLIKENKNKVKFLYLSHPNNPLGVSYDHSQLIKVLKICESYNLYVIIDEAYIDFSGEKSLSSYLGQYSNLIIVRTLSKAYGQAGIKTGYILATEDLITLLDVTRNINTYNHLGILLAINKLNDKAIVQESIQEMNEVKSYFCMSLEEKGIQYIPTCTNFVTVSTQDSFVVEDTLLSQRIVVKNLSHYIFAEGTLDNYIRVTIGPKKVMDIILKIL